MKGIIKIDYLIRRITIMLLCCIFLVLFGCTYTINSTISINTNDNYEIQGVDGNYIYCLGDMNSDEYTYSSIFIADMRGNIIKKAYSGNYVEIEGVKNGYVYFNDYYESPEYATEADFCALNVDTEEVVFLDNYVEEYDYHYPMKIEGLYEDCFYYKCKYYGDIGPADLYYSSIDGSENNLITGNSPTGYLSLNVYNDNLYYTEIHYIDGCPAYSVIKSNKDGSNQYTIREPFDSSWYKYCGDSDYYYLSGYIGDRAYFEMHNLATDERDRMSVGDSNSDYLSSFITQYNTISFLAEDNGEIYYKTGFDGGNCEIITEDKVVKSNIENPQNFINVVDGFLYYTDDSKKVVYREKIGDGEESLFKQF